MSQEAKTVTAVPAATPKTGVTVEVRDTIKTGGTLKKIDVTHACVDCGRSAPNLEDGRCRRCGEKTKARAKKLADRHLASVVGGSPEPDEDD